VNYVEKPAGNGIVVPFTISKSGVKGTVSGVVWRLDPATRTFSLSITNGTLTTAYVGGQIEVAGVMMTIQSVNTQNNTVVVQPLVNIPFELVDDDTATMPHVPDTTQMQPSFAVAYVEPVFDGGGNIANNTITVPFKLNVPVNQSVTVQMWNSKGNNSDNYWVAYILTAYQRSVLDDRDPNSEAGTFGVTADPSGGSLIFLERHFENDIINRTLEEQDTVNHEVSHVFGSVDIPGEPTDGRGNFTPKTLDLIRKRIRPLP
jgi:hypothetical protein